MTEIKKKMVITDKEREFINECYQKRNELFCRCGKRKLELPNTYCAACKQELGFTSGTKHKCDKCGEMFQQQKYEHMEKAIERHKNNKHLSRAALEIHQGESKKEKVVLERESARGLTYCKECDDLYILYKGENQAEALERHNKAEHEPKAPYDYVYVPQKKTQGGVKMVHVENFKSYEDIKILPDKAKLESLETHLACKVYSSNADWEKTYLGYFELVGRTSDDAKRTDFNEHVQGKWGMNFYGDLAILFKKDVKGKVLFPGPSPMCPDFVGISSQIISICVEFMNSDSNLPMSWMSLNSVFENFPKKFILLQRK